MNKVLKVLGGIAAVMVSIIYFGLLMAFSFTLSITNIVNKDNLKSYIESVDIMDLPISSVVNDQEENRFQDSETIKDFLGDVLENSGFTNEEATKVLNNEGAQNILNNYIYGMLNYGLYGEELPVLNSEEVLATITDLGVELNQNEENEITSLVNELNEKSSTVLEIDQIKSDKIPYVDNFQNALNILNSTWLKISLGIAFVFTFFLIALFRWSLYKPFIWLGIPTIIVGFITSLIGSTKFLLNNITIPEIGSYQNILESLVNPFLSNILITGLGIIASGIIMIVVYTLINNYKHEKEEPKID